MLLASGALALLLAGSGPRRAPRRERARRNCSPPRTWRCLPNTSLCWGPAPPNRARPAGATWGLGEQGSEPELVRYTPPSGEEGGWEPGPALPVGFKPRPSRRKTEPARGADVTPEGYGVLAGTTAGGGQSGARAQARRRLRSRAAGARRSRRRRRRRQRARPAKKTSLHTGQRLFEQARADDRALAGSRRLRRCPGRAACDAERASTKRCCTGTGDAGRASGSKSRHREQKRIQRARDRSERAPKTRGCSRASPKPRQGPVALFHRAKANEGGKAGSGSRSKWRSAGPGEAGAGRSRQRRESSLASSAAGARRLEDQG